MNQPTAALSVSDLRAGRRHVGELLQDSAFLLYLRKSPRYTSRHKDKSMRTICVSPLLVLLFASSVLSAQQAPDRSPHQEAVKKTAKVSSAGSNHSAPGEMSVGVINGAKKETKAFKAPETRSAAPKVGQQRKYAAKRAPKGPTQFSVEVMNGSTRSEEKFGTQPQQSDGRDNGAGNPHPPTIGQPTVPKTPSTAPKS